MTTAQDALLELLPAEMDDVEFTRCCTGSCNSNASETDPDHTYTAL